MLLGIERNIVNIAVARAAVRLIFYLKSEDWSNRGLVKQQYFIVKGFVFTKCSNINGHPCTLYLNITRFR